MSNFKSAHLPAASARSGEAGIEIEPRVLRFGLKQHMRRGNLVLCVVSPVSLRLISLGGPRMVISWEYPLAGPVTPRYYVIPRIAAQVLSSMVGQELARLTLETVGPQTILMMDDGHSQYELRWQADLRQFVVPPEFTSMLAVPRSMITTDYITLSDAAHQAVADLMSLYGVQGVPKEKLAILVDYAASHLLLDGRTIIHGARGAFYFDPRLIIRALETIKSHQVQVGITPLSGIQRAVLTLLADQDGWRVQCALLSIGTETQKPYPLPADRLGAAQS
jgi:hypothetical protein